MEANKLMIGDWVLYGKRYAIVKRIEYSRCDILVCVTPRHDDIVTETYDNIEPIPITPEILEKNEFERTELGFYCYLNDDKNCRIMYYPKDRNYTHGSYNYADIDSGCIDINELPLESVHELQHVLRLCGLTELADNFKVG